ncbi:MAG: hypothetical protein RIE56_00305 [Amphiplicatus sp.]
MQTATKAIIRNDVFYAQGDRPSRAPCGEYALDVSGDSRVAFHGGGDDTRFSLSLDTVLQHVFEGRMRLI